MAGNWARLDRALCNVKCLEVIPSASLKYLPWRTSDHAPMILGLLSLVLKYGPSSFKFQQMWTTHEDFMSCVTTSWQESTEGLGLWKLAEKLKRLKVVLRSWNK